MRPVKSAEQRNVTLDTGYYTIKELERIATLNGVFTLRKGRGEVVCVSLAQVKAIRVVLDEFGFYRNEVELKTGEHLYVIL